MTEQSTKLKSSGNCLAIDQLENTIAAELEATPYDELTEIECDCGADRVVLRGTVPSFHLMQQALHAAMRVAGSVEIESEIEVTPVPRR